ncbi:hypothetical protein [Methylobacter svalbardensis]|uniref:hypothetical protein n=1 Tax=Methylobacter svalbardensis TaxID=3080016 RepID=UPI0030EC8294
MIYGIPDPEDDFAVAIAAWSIKEVIYGENTEPTRHLVGYILQDSEGRASSAIQSFDKENRLIETRSGRLYKLHGKPGDHPDARYVWQRWKGFNNVQDEKDVTDEYLK